MIAEELNRIAALEQEERSKYRHRMFVCMGTACMASHSDGIKAALDAGADVVVTGRVTDASLAIGAAAAAHGWGYHDLDALAGATVAGHIIECGAQATGGNYAFFSEVPAWSTSASRGPRWPTTAAA